jgi:integrase/recombinase XerC
MSSIKDLPNLNEFLLYLSNNNYSLETVKNYKRDLAIFSYFLRLNNLSFSKISKKEVTIFKGYLKNGNNFQFLTENKEIERHEGNKSISSSNASKNDENIRSGLSSRSINRMLSSLRSFLRFLIDFDYKTPLAPDAVKLIKTEKKESQVAEFNDLVRLVEFPSVFEKDKFVAKRNRALLELLFSSGMRISEVVNLNLDDIDLTPDHLHIREGKIFIMGKGKKQRFVYLTERSKKYLDEYLMMRKDSYKSLFIPKRGKRAGTHDLVRVKLSARYIQDRIARYRRLLGIIVPTTPHSLRHGFATYLAEQGASPVAIQHLLGHESLQTTTKYVHASDKFAQETHRKYHPLKT